MKLVMRKRNDMKDHLCKTGINRTVFAIVFVLGLAVIYGGGELAHRLYYAHVPMDDFRFNIALGATFAHGCLAYLTGLVPMGVWMLATTTISTWEAMSTVGCGLFVEAVALDIGFVVYLMACDLRCRHMGCSWWFCLIPLFNPFMLLFKKMKR